MTPPPVNPGSSAAPAGQLSSPPPALLTEEEARDHILKEMIPLSVVSVGLLAARGRFAARAVRAGHSLPGFDNSSMDGYAVAFPPAADGSSPPPALPASTRLTVSGEQPAGPSRGLRVRPGEAVRIFTGAPIPEGTGAVVMQEDVERDGGEIVLTCDAALGEYIRRAGSDLARGQTLFEAGVPLTAQRLGLLASQGLAEVEIRRAPRVAVLATGDELRAPGEPLGPGEIYESNSTLLAALTASVGAEVTVLTRAADERADLDAKLAAGLDKHDVLIVAGGVSVGERDFVKERLAAAGVALNLWRVAIQPGKPFLYGKAEGVRQKAEGRGQRAEGPSEDGEQDGGGIGEEGGTHVFGLPGNPVSAFVTFLLFVRPALLKLMGASGKECTPPGFFAVAGEELVTYGSRPHFLRGQVDENGRFFLCGRQESHAIFGLSRSNALVRVEPGVKVPAGAPVKVFVAS